ncbi:MAG: hypothetical protein ACRYFV_20620 [Janthinobacterium lividum]
MPFLSPKAAAEFAELVQFHDAVCRHELAHDYLVSERDYVSALATHLRFPFGGRAHNPLPPAAGVPLPFYCPPITSITLPSSKEQKLGCDGIIVFSAPPGSNQTDHLYKVGFFEAKWPRLSKHRNYPWDATSHYNHSHFSHQLERQRSLAAMPEVVVWEMFFSEEAVGTTSSHSPHPWGSTCIRHRQAWNHVKANPDLAPSGAGASARRWKSTDLATLMKAGTTQSLASLIEDIVSCKVGKPIKGTTSSLILRLPPDAVERISERVGGNTSLANGILTIPILNSDNNIGEIQDFMREFGLRSYTIFPLDEDAINTAFAESRKAKIAALLESLISE